jgi:hypothetical protein
MSRKNIFDNVGIVLFGETRQRDVFAVEIGQPITAVAVTDGIQKRADRSGAIVD